MIVRHWMQADPVVIAGDTLVSEAKRILSAVSYTHLTLPTSDLV